MATDWQRIKMHLKNNTLKKVVKTTAWFLLGLLSVVLVSTIVFSVYFESHKAEIVSQINKKINDNISGTITIKDVDYKFFKGFPNLTLALSQVEVKDSLWFSHKRTLLKAAQVQVRVNVFGFLANEVMIDKVEIEHATLHLYKGKNGMDNTAIFRPKTTNKKSSSTTTSIEAIVLDQVHFISENEATHKLFDFDVLALRSEVDYDGEDWKTTAYLKTMANSMAFNTQRGSFIKGRIVEGFLKVDFAASKNQINVATDQLAIGDDNFIVNAHFSLDKDKSPFDIAIQTKIRWRDASALLSENISEKINQFDFKNTLQVGCTIVGDMNAAGDPEIIVHAKIKDNELHIPDGTFTDCTFDATFTNNYKKGAGCNDVNSTITFTDFKAKYKTIPFTIPVGIISNFEKTTAAGSFRSDFSMLRLNTMLQKDIIHFSSGQAKVNLDFKFDVVDLKIKKPLFTGNVFVKDAVMTYGPRNLSFLKTDIQLDFTEKALLIKKINFKNERSSVFMEGKIDNFLTLYYDNPQKMVVNWKVYAPFLDVKQFVGAITTASKTPSRTVPENDDFSSDLYAVIDKCQVILDLKADKITYGKLVASNTKATVTLKENKLIVKNGWVQSSGGVITFDGELNPDKEDFQVASNVKISKVDLPLFLASVNNFGIQSFGPQNIKGLLNASATVKGRLLSGGQLKTNSLSGTAKFKVVEGELLDFKPITNIAKFAFPFRNVNAIVFSDLSGNFKIKGERVAVDNLKVSSNILNLDANGVYSFNRGTNLALTIPLRNPKKDSLISNEEALLEKRYKGLVLYLLAVDVDGKIKIRWNKNHQ